MANAQERKLVPYGRSTKSTALAELHKQVKKKHRHTHLAGAPRVPLDEVNRLHDQLHLAAHLNARGDELEDALEVQRGGARLLIHVLVHCV